jgi:hypothetical protein
MVKSRAEMMELAGRLLAEYAAFRRGEAAELNRVDSKVGGPTSLFLRCFFS